MSAIRRQTIISSLLIYIGFAFGALNTYLFVKEGIFNEEQYGLTRAIIVVGQFFYGFAGFGLASVIYKFFPYYKDNLPKERNDLLTISLIVAVIGFALSTAGGILLEPLVIKKFSERSLLLVQYYYWVFPFTFFLLFFTILEAYAWSIGKAIIPNFLREAGFRISTTVLIGVFVLTGKNFNLFIKLFSLTYAVSFIVLLIYLMRLKEFHLTTEISKVSKKFWRKILTLMGYVYGGTIINASAQAIDFLAIASFRGLRSGAIFDFSTYLANVIQVPQRSLISVTIPVLSRAWKEKDYSTIDRVYKRSSINLLLMSLFMFGFVWLNFDDAIVALNLKSSFAEGKWVVFLLGIKNIIDMGTGVNAQIIATSVYWRFDFFTGVILLLLLIPLNILLVKEFGIIGAAWSALVAYSIYNLIRLLFLKRRFDLLPFTPQTVSVLLHSAICFTLIYFVFENFSGWTAIFLRSLSFAILFIATAIYFNISPDIKPVVLTIRKRLRF